MFIYYRKFHTVCLLQVSIGRCFTITVKPALRLVAVKAWNRSMGLSWLGNRRESDSFTGDKAMVEEWNKAKFAWFVYGFNRCGDYSSELDFRWALMLSLPRRVSLRGLWSLAINIFVVLTVVTSAEGTCRARRWNRSEGYFIAANLEVPSCFLVSCPMQPSHENREASWPDFFEEKKSNTVNVATVTRISFFALKRDLKTVFNKLYLNYVTIFCVPCCTSGRLKQKKLHKSGSKDNNSDISAIILRYDMQTKASLTKTIC